MILIINLGLKSIRAIVFDRTGRVLGKANQSVHSRLFNERVEQDPKEWLTKMAEVVRFALDKANCAGKISHISIACSASCLVPVDENLRPLSHAVMVSDKRAGEEGRAIAASEKFGPLAEKFGYSSSEYSQMARILWFKKNEPEIFANTRWFLAPNDFLAAFLTKNRPVTDSLNASKSYYDPESSRYPSELYEEFGLTVECLPAWLPIGTGIGKVDASVAAELGLSVRPEVVLGTYDAICSVFGSGVCSPGMVCDVSGTVTSVRMYSDAPFLDPKRRLACQHFPPTGGYLIGGSNNLGGGIIEWAKHCFYSGEANPYDSMQMDCSREGHLSPNRSCLIFLPHLLGARAPGWNATARGCFFGLERNHSRAELMLAVFESLAFSVREFLDVFRETGVAPSMVTASGGLARIPVANMLKATITGLPYHLQDEFESTSLGAAIIVLCARGEYASYEEACGNVSVTRQIFLPQKRNTAYYDDMYGLYKELAETMEPMFEKRKLLAGKHSPLSVEFVENL